MAMASLRQRRKHGHFDRECAGCEKPLKKLVGMVFNGMHWGNGSMKQWECLLFKTSASVRWTHCCDVKTVVL